MSSFSKRGAAQPAAVRISVTWSRSAKANIPGAFGTGFGRGGKCCATAVIGTSIHGFSASVRQLTSAMRASGAALRRILAKAATLSPKNITPKAEVNKSYSSNAAVAGSACRQSTLAIPAAVARLSPSASIGPEISKPVTRPVGHTARANSNVGAPHPQPISTTRSPARGAAKASKASVTGRSVMSVWSCRATQVWPPFPFQKASMSALISSGATMVVLLSELIRYGGADRAASDAPAGPVRVKSGHLSGRCRRPLLTQSGHRAGNSECRPVTRSGLRSAFFVGEFQETTCSTETSCHRSWRSFVSGKKTMPMAAVASAIVVGYHRPAKMLP